MTFPVRLAVHRLGRPGGRRALMLHGLGSDGRTLWRLADHLAAGGWWVWCPDLRGHGSSPTAAHFGLDAFAADVAALGSRWDLVVGHSLGGSIVGLLLPRPGWGARALLVDPVLWLDDAGRRGVRSMRDEVGGALSVTDLRAAQPRWDDEDVRRKVAAAATVTPRVVDATLAHNRPWDLGGAVAAWPDGVRVLAADPRVDTLFPTAHAAHVRELAPRTEVRVVPGAGHSVHRDDPAAVVAVLDDLTAEQSGV